MRRIRWLALGAAALVFIGAGLSRISFNVDILKLLPTRLPQVEGLSLFLKNFAQPRELIVTIEAKDSDTADAAADELAEIFRRRTDLVSRPVARPPWEKNPAGLAELLAFLLLNQPPEKVAELRARIAPERVPATLQATLEKLNESISPQEIALRSYDPFDFAAPLASAGLMSGGAQSEFSSADGAFRVIYVESARAFPNYKSTIAWLKEIKRIAAEWRGARDIRLGFTGEPAFVADISGSTEWDMMSSGFVTLIVIALIFWLCYRRARPLLDLQAMLVLVFTVSLTIAGLFLDQLTVIGVGCAAIMIGLSVDYGYFVYQRSQRHRGSVRELQRQCVQNIAWTSGTTAAAFFALNLSSLPGLSQLGNLVGIGVIVGAFVMLGIFAPLTMRFHRREGERAPSLVERLVASPRFLRNGAWVTLVVIAVLLGVLFVKGLPGVDFSARSLRPRVSEAYTALDRLYEELTDERDLLSLVVSGANEDEVLERLRKAEAALAAARDRGDARSFRTALPIWPDPANQRANLATLAALTPEAPRLKAAMQAAGFNDEAFALTEGVLEQWAAWSARTPPIWPENESSRWIFRRAAHRGDAQQLAMGMVQSAPGRDEAIAAVVESPGVYLVSWNRLGAELRRVIPREFAHVILGLVAAVLLLLAIAFRSARAVALFAITTALVLTCLAGAMSLFGMKWNFFDLAAVLLLLGTGTDYSILLLLALKRNGGDAHAAQRELGLVICL
ncbi:MAG TPA: MMPL family transporter, partial [Chthoniobacteraceae bacterium]|nr:MMPL family transporter [Chthoniobacteraceae bacterium]